MKKYLMAIDAGTGSVRAVLFDTDGNQISHVQKEWTHAEDPRYPGSMDFDWEHNWKLASHCIKNVIAKAAIDPKDIAAVSTTCMREGIVLYDSKGEEIWACANVDARSIDEVSELMAMDPELEKNIYLESGETFALGALPRLLWIKNKQPDIYEKISTLSMFNDWLIYKLTGITVSEPSNSSTTGIFNLENRSWAPSIAERCGLRSDIFPPMRECGSVAGKVNQKGSLDTGLAEDTLVVVGGGDAQLGCIGVGVVENNQAAIFGGSFWQYEYNTIKAHTDEKCRVRVNCHAVPGMWQYEALAFQPGMVMRWFRDAFCQHEKEIGEKTGKDPYDLMNEKAAEIPAGCHGMMCVFSDVMNFIKWRHASPAFLNFDLDPEKFNRFTFYRAIMENTALVTYGHMLLVEEATGNIPDHLVFAGGASKSELWCQILADVLGKTVFVPVVKEATALGAAILAGYGAGIYEDIPSAAKNLVKWEKEFLPNFENHQIYQQMYPIWREVYSTHLNTSNQGLTKHMWLAPGQ